MNPIIAPSQIWIRRTKKYRDIYLQNKEENAYKNLAPQNVEFIRSVRLMASSKKPKWKTKLIVTKYKIKDLR